MRNIPKYFQVEPSDNTLILSARTSVKMLTDKELREECHLVFDQLSQYNATNLVIDLWELDHYDSVLLEFFVILWKHIKIGTGKFVVCNVSDFGKQTLRATKFDTLWTISSSREEALTFSRS
jgi:anti-anti-sigma factor